jgi:ubiquitin-protein ligase
MNERELIHKRRLRGDYESMKRLSGPMLSWVPASDKNPPDKYRVTINVLAETIQGEACQHVIEIDCSSLDYPRQEPELRFLSNVVKHPHVFSSGRICIGKYSYSESLAQLCIRLCRFLQYDPELINPRSIATTSFNQWYEQNKWRFPLDTSPLPTLADSNPSPGGMEILERRKSSSPQKGGLEIREIRRKGSF